MQLDPGILSLSFIGSIGWPEMVVLALLGVLIFGKRLPEVGKSIGKGIVEFKKGLQGIDDDVDQSVNRPQQVEDKRTAEVSTDTDDADPVVADEDTGEPAVAERSH